MACMKRWRKGLSLLLALVLLIGPGMQVGAEELAEDAQPHLEQAETEEPEPSEEPALPEETVTPEETEIPEETESPEKTEIPEETESPEKTEIPKETESPEESEAPQEPILPEETVIPEESEAPEEPSLPEERELPEEQAVSEESEEPEMLEASRESEAPEETSALSHLQPIPIGEVLQLPAGEQLLAMTGTVVYADAFQAVLQDETGGIRLSFPTPPEIVPGDLAVVSGYRRSGFAVEKWEKTGTGPLPAVESTLKSHHGDIRIRINAAVLGEHSLSQNGYTCQLEGSIPDGIQPGDRVNAWGVVLDGVFYADTMVLSEEQPPEEGFASDWNFYFGQLHAHTDLSDGTGTVKEAFAYAKAVENLDFFAVTDHSNAFDNGAYGAVTEDGRSISRKWAAGKAAAEQATDDTFVGIFGYEMTWPEDLAIGHINTFATPGWLTRDQAGMNTLEGYLDALAAVPDSVSQFNHPGIFYGDFCGFSQYSPQQDARVHLLEVGGEGTFTAYDAFTAALDAGWHLAPSNNQNNHQGNWGNDSQARTVVLARELSEEAIFDALRHYRAYASEDADLKIEYRLNQEILGSTLAETETLTADILLEDGSGDPIGLVEVITDQGTVAARTEVEEAVGACSLEVPTGGSYYYLRISRNGKTVAVTAPVWVDTYEDLGITEFASDVEKPEQGTDAALTLTLYNHEHLPFVVETVVFSIGDKIVETILDPGSVAPVGTLDIPITYTQVTAGTVTITATVSGTIAELPRTCRKDITLKFQPPEAKSMSVEKVRSGILGDAYRIHGFVTAGTANRHNTFPDSIYLQDDSGGIAVVDFDQEGIQLGTPMEIEGILRSVGGNLVLAMTDYEILQEDYYRYVPRTMSHQTAMNYKTHGGELLQIEGNVVSVTKTPDQKGVSRFTIRDIVGNLATVVVEEDIGSGAYGTNELTSEVRLSGTTRAMGLLHIDEYGKTVLRVRNCDEVVYVPPVNDPSNPKTGDWFAWLTFWR